MLLYILLSAAFKLRLYHRDLYLGLLPDRDAVPTMVNYEICQKFETEFVNIHAKQSYIHVKDTTNYCLTVSKERSDELIYWSHHGGADQKWIIVHGKLNAIRLRHEDECLEYLPDDDVLRMQSCNESENQLFNMIEDEDEDHGLPTQINVTNTHDLDYNALHEGHSNGFGPGRGSAHGHLGGAKHGSGYGNVGGGYNGSNGGGLAGANSRDLGAINGDNSGGYAGANSLGANGYGSANGAGGGYGGLNGGKGSGNGGYGSGNGGYGSGNGYGGSNGGKSSGSGGHGGSNAGGHGGHGASSKGTWTGHGEIGCFQSQDIINVASISDSIATKNDINSLWFDQIHSKSSQKEKRNSEERKELQILTTDSSSSDEYNKSDGFNNQNSKTGGLKEGSSKSKQARKKSGMKVSLGNIHKAKSLGINGSTKLQAPDIVDNGSNSGWEHTTSKSTTVTTSEAINGDEFCQNTKSSTRSMLLGNEKDDVDDLHKSKCGDWDFHDKGHHPEMQAYYDHGHGSAPA